jgi:hypothetical protein
MKRDMELIRTILNEIEEQTGPPTNHKISIDGYDDAIIAAHIELLIEAGLIKGKVMRNPAGVQGALVERLTWDGYEFVNVSRDKNWKKAKELLLSHGVSITFDLLLEYLKAEARKHLPIL